MFEVVVNEIFDGMGVEIKREEFGKKVGYMLNVFAYDTNKINVRV